MKRNQVTKEKDMQMVIYFVHGRGRHSNNGAKGRKNKDWESRNIKLPSIRFGIQYPKTRPRDLGLDNFEMGKLQNLFKMLETFKTIAAEP